jgi:UDP-glucose 4-epimerase
MIAVVGATGLIGAAAARHLGQRTKVVTIGRSAKSDIVADLADPASIAKIELDGCEAMVHCAGVVDEDFADPGRAFRQATLGMAALVKRAKELSIPRFAYISTAHVYGPLVGRLTEASPPNPLHDYAIAHYASEQTLRRATGPAFRAAAFRPCAVFGMPEDLSTFRRWGLIPFGFPRDVVRNHKIVLGTSGRQLRNFVGTEDIARAIATWLDDASAAPFTAINPVGKANLSVYDFARLCCAIGETVTGAPCTVTRNEADTSVVPDLDYATLDPRFVGSADLAAAVEAITARLHAG